MSNESLTYNQFEIVSNENDTSVDVRAGAPLLEYRESVFSHYVMVSASIVDTGRTIVTDGRGVGILEAIKMQGGEKVYLSLTDAKGNKIRLDDEDSLRLVKVDNINETFKSTSFTITCFSPEAITDLDVNNYCYDLYTGRTSDIIRDVVEKHLKSEKEFYAIDLSRNNVSVRGYGVPASEYATELQMLSVPNETTNQSGERNTMAGYLFWQTSEGFHFKSLDTIFKTTGSYLGFRDSNNQRVKNFIEMFRGDDYLPPGFDDKIVHSTFNRSIDLISQFKSGAYGSKLETMDLVEQTWNDTNESVVDSEGNRILAGKNLPNIGEYTGTVTRKIPQTKAKGQTVISGDSLQTQVEKTTEQKYDVDEITQQAIQNYRQKMNFSLQIIIPGDFSLHAGDVIYCEFRELSDSKTTLSSRDRNSGLYMIADLCHFGNKSKTYTGLHLVRDSYGAKTNG